MWDFYSQVNYPYLHIHLYCLSAEVRKNTSDIFVVFMFMFYFIYNSEMYIIYPAVKIVERLCYNEIVYQSTFFYIVLFATILSFFEWNSVKSLVSSSHSFPITLYDIKSVFTEHVLVSIFQPFLMHRPVKQ